MTTFPMVNRSGPWLRIDLGEQWSRHVVATSIVSVDVDLVEQPGSPPADVVQLSLRCTGNTTIVLYTAPPWSRPDMDALLDFARDILAALR